LRFYAYWIPSPDRSLVDSLDSPGASFGTSREKAKELQEEIAENDLSSA
jgi:hypothetical protein